ncbi:MAG: homocysteine biosynthesis protein [Prevotellaceae bacterium]|jgi:uncharacterized protein (DUF39 family)|nr:homocysteine biosynthesis protein [Prevotellaceae bacterium]
MARTKSYEEINAKIKKGKAVILTAEEVATMSRELSPKQILKKVDIVTTATFGAMCSSGAFLNLGHTNPPMRMERITLNGVSAYGGIAAVDTYIGATQESSENARYGGAHVIQELIEGKDVLLEAWGKGTDCYPRKYIKSLINKDSINEAYLFNPRNAYQNYNVAVNSSAQEINTYMGKLSPNLGNATYSTSGEMSPLLNDPTMRTIGIGTRVFIGGTQGFVAWHGTQFDTSKPKNEFGVPVNAAATLALIGDLKNMSSEFIKAAYFTGYGVTLFIGIGIPIPILDEDIAKGVSIRDEQIEACIYDYGKSGRPPLGRVSYSQLRSGSIELNGGSVKTTALSSLTKARQIASILRLAIKEGRFDLVKPVQAFPTNATVKKLIEREP